MFFLLYNLLQFFFLFFFKKTKCQKRSKQLLPGRCASAFRQIGDAQVVDADGVIVIDAGHTRHSHRLPRRTASVGKPINSQIKKSIKNSSIEPKEKNHKINKPSCQRASKSKKKNGRYANQVVAPKKKQRRPRRVQTQRKSLDKNSTVAPTGVLARPSSVTISRSRVRGDTARGRCFPAIVKVFRPTPANAPPANGFGR